MLLFRESSSTTRCIDIFFLLIFFLKFVFKSYKLPSNLASQVAKLLKLNLVQEIAVGLCLKSSSRDEIRKSSIDLLKQRIPELVELQSQQDQQAPAADLPSINDLPIDLLQQVLIEAHSTQADYTDLVKKLFSGNIFQIVCCFTFIYNYLIESYASDVIQPVSSSSNFNLNNLETGNHLKHLKVLNLYIVVFDLDHISYVFYRWRTR